MTKVAVPMATVAAVVGDNCNRGDDGRGIDGGSDDGSCSEENATVAVVAMETAMAVARGQRQRQQQGWQRGEIQQ